MKKWLAILLVLCMAIPAAAGSYTTNNYFWVPNYNESGPAAYSNYKTALITTDAFLATLAPLPALIAGWAIEDQIVTMIPVTCTYSDNNTFTLPGDYTSRFATGAVVQVHVAAGMVYSTVASSSYAAPTTTVNLNDTVLTDPITRVYVVATRDGLWPNGPGYVVARDYGTDRAALEAADAVAAAAGKELRITATFSIDDDVALVAPKVTVQPGVPFAISTTKTLTINGALDAGLYQIFSSTGTGKVLFGDGAVKENYPQWWGGVADNTTVSTAAIQAAMNAFGGLSGSRGSVKITGAFLIDGNLILPRQVSLLGVDPEQSVIRSATEHSITISTGAAFSGMIHHLIGNIDFYSVGLVYGDSDINAGFGSHIFNSNIHGCTKAITYNHGIWEMLIHGCHIYQNKIGIYYDFTLAGAGTYTGGAPIVVSDTFMYNHLDSGSGACVYVNGITPDGVDLKLTNCDFQSSDWGLVVNNLGASPAMIYLNNPHFENSLYGNIKATGALVNVDGVWDFTSNEGLAGFVAHYVCDDANSTINLNSGRIGWGLGKLYKLAAGGKIFLDMNKFSSMFMTSPLTAGESCVAGPVGNLLYPKNFEYGSGYGASIDITGFAYLFDSIFKGDTNTHYYRQHITTTTQAGAVPLYVARFVGDVTPYDAITALPNETGFMDVEIWVSASFVTTKIHFVGSATNTVYYTQVANGRTVAELGTLYTYVDGTDVVAGWAVLNDYTKTVK